MKWCSLALSLASSITNHMLTHFPIPMPSILYRHPSLSLHPYHLTHHHHYHHHNHSITQLPTTPASLPQTRRCCCLPTTHHQQENQQPLPESKACATARLKKSGLWDEAAAYKDSIISSLRLNGEKRAIAVERAWAAGTARSAATARAEKLLRPPMAASWIRNPIQRRPIWGFWIRTFLMRVVDILRRLRGRFHH